MGSSVFLIEYIPTKLSPIMVKFICALLLSVVAASSLKANVALDKKDANSMLQARSTRVGETDKHWEEEFIYEPSRNNPYSFEEVVEYIQMECPNNSCNAEERDECNRTIKNGW